MKFIIGKKLPMTQIWRGDEVAAVTGIQAGPCTVVQVKKEDKDGYAAVQLGYGEKKVKNIGKAMRGHLRGLGNFRHLREFRLESADGLARGDVIGADNFAGGDRIQVAGTSKGKGFQGGVKRHGFSGSKKTHGNKDQLRMSGSVGATGPAHVFKGTRMPGHMGDERVTVKNLEIVEVDADKNILYVKGAVPGAVNGLVMVSGPGELKVKSGKRFAAEKSAEDKEDKKEARPAETPPVSAKNPQEENVDTAEKVEREVVEAKDRADKNNNPDEVSAKDKGN
jgi:large subunit ribosomal protein L3